MRRFAIALVCGLLFCKLSSAWGQEKNLAPEELGKLSLEELMNLDVTSVSKTPQKLSQTPAAVTIITQEDIHRSGMTTIPDLLRLAPGLDVARVNGNRWAISSRGFNDLYANKLLVLFDGRTIYTHLFSGVYWDAQDYMLEDLDRIEVVRGPGATLWGANAVNGVINIVSKSARDTQGVLVDGLWGNLDRSAGVRYGGAIDDRTYYRIYGKFRDIEDMKFADGSDEGDGGELSRGGFRLDRYSSDNDLLTFEGDWYGGTSGQPLAVPTFTPPFRALLEDQADIRGGDLLGRWSHKISAREDFSLQLYYDRLERDDAQLSYQLDTFDIEFQHRFPLARRHEVIWGLNGRFQEDSIGNSPLLTFDPQHRDTEIGGGFVQDDWTIVPDRFHLMFGTKLDVNSFTGLEVQPGVRLLWTPNERNTFWAAVSRAVRTPSRWEEDANIIFARGPTATPLPFEVALHGVGDLDSEELIAYELGHRVQVTSAVSLDTSLFYNTYHDLRNAQTLEPTPVAGPPPHLLIPAELNNRLEADSYGGEIATTWNVSSDLRLIGSYTLLNVVAFNNGSTSDLGNEAFIEGADPQQQFQIRSYLNLRKNLELNAALYFVDDLRTGDVPAYARLDVGLTWRPGDGVEVAAVLQNALDNQHPEFANRLNNVATEIPRAFYVQLTWRH
jgi:iron complex outermembrane receptor protein